MFAPIRIKHYFAAFSIAMLNALLMNMAIAQSAMNEIRIRADYMQFDLESGDSIYEGNVSIVQGGIKLTGSKVVIRRNQQDNREISDIEVSGEPARYKQDENTQNMVNAVSQQMKYSTSESRLVMTDNARLEQADHIVESQRIVYDTANKVIIAGTGASEKTPGERVNITLTPKKTSPNPAR